MEQDYKESVDCVKKHQKTKNLGFTGLKPTKDLEKKVKRIGLLILEFSKTYRDASSEFTLGEGNPFLGVAIVIDKRYKNQVSGEKIGCKQDRCGSNYLGRYLNQCIIKGKIDEFYSVLEDTLVLLSRSDIKLMLGDFTAKVRKTNYNND